MAQADGTTSDLRTEIGKIRSDIEAILAQPYPTLFQEPEQWAAVVLRASAALLAATSFGECRRARPFAPLRPVIEADGALHWCCAHDPEHRAT
ncbi:MAG: hypothetical protein ACREIY_03945 [Candidatus Rokuibacteriota bacterium]